MFSDYKALHQHSADQTMLMISSLSCASRISFARVSGGEHSWHWARTPRASSFHWLEDQASVDRRLLSFRPTCHFSFIPPLRPCPLFILMWSGRSSWWWHGVDYAVPTVTDSKAAREGTIVAFDLWVTALPVAPAPHWRSHGARRAGRACMDQTGQAGAPVGFSFTGKCWRRKTFSLYFPTNRFLKTQFYLDADQYFFFI